MPFMPPTQEDIDHALDASIRIFADGATSAVFGANPIPRDMSFAQLETLSSEIGRRVAQRLAERVLQQHTAETPLETPCPQCGRVCRVVQHQRPIQTLDGNITYREPACHCETCRRNFFSGPSEPETR